jgi:hypothetical protein
LKNGIVERRIRISEGYIYYLLVDKQKASILTYIRTGGKEVYKKDGPLNDAW